MGRKSESDALNLRDAGPLDADILFEWRNDPATRLNSIRGEEVAPDEHRAWFAGTLGNPDRQLVIAEIAGRPVAVVRADRKGALWELSWTVAPEARGRGYGKRAVAEMAGRLNRPVCARIKEGNAASEAIARAAGLSPRSTGEGVTVWATTDDLALLMDDLEGTRR